MAGGAMTTSVIHQYIGTFQHPTKTTIQSPNESLVQKFLVNARDVTRIRTSVRIQSCVVEPTNERRFSLLVDRVHFEIASDEKFARHCERCKVLDESGVKKRVDRTWSG